MSLQSVANCVQILCIFFNLQPSQTYYISANACYSVCG